MESCPIKEKQISAKWPEEKNTANLGGIKQAGSKRVMAMHVFQIYGLIILHWSDKTSTTDRCARTHSSCCHFLIFGSVTMSWNVPTHGPVHGYSVNQHLLDQAKASVHFFLVAVIPQNRQRNLHVIMFKQSALVCWLIVVNVIKRATEPQTCLTQTRSQSNNCTAAGSKTLSLHMQSLWWPFHHQTPNSHSTCLCI